MQVAITAAYWAGLCGLWYTFHTLDIAYEVPAT